MGGGAVVIKKLGAVPVGLAGAEIYEALERGTINGVVMPPTGINTWKLIEVAKYYTRIVPDCSVFYLMMNKDSWLNRKSATLEGG